MRHLDDFLVTGLATKAFGHLTGLESLLSLDATIGGGILAVVG